MRLIQMDNKVYNKRYIAARENRVHDATAAWLELEFYTRSRTLKGEISCPTGMRILDMLNIPYSVPQNARVEFIELKDYLTTDSDGGDPKTVCVKKDDI